MHLYFYLSVLIFEVILSIFNWTCDIGLLFVFSVQPDMGYSRTANKFSLFFLPSFAEHPTCNLTCHHLENIRRVFENCTIWFPSEFLILEIASRPIFYYSHSSIKKKFRRTPSCGKEKFHAAARWVDSRHILGRL